MLKKLFFGKNKTPTPAFPEELFSRCMESGKGLTLTEETILATDGDYSERYARLVLKGRFWLGEPQIAREGHSASHYLHKVIAVYCPDQYDSAITRMLEHNPRLAIRLYPGVDYEVERLKQILDAGGTLEVMPSPDAGWFRVNRNSISPSQPSQGLPVKSMRVLNQEPKRGSATVSGNVELAADVLDAIMAANPVLAQALAAETPELMPGL